MKKNSTLIYFILILIAIATGITSRKINGVPTFIGDALYAVMIYFGIRITFENKSIKSAAILGLIFCFIIEFAQLYNALWMVEIRRSTLGHYVLGQSFLWSDLTY